MKTFECKRENVITYEKHDYLNTKKKIMSMETKTNMKACYGNKVRVYGNKVRVIPAWT